MSEEIPIQQNIDQNSIILDPNQNCSPSKFSNTNNGIEQSQNRKETSNTLEIQNEKEDQQFENNKEQNNSANIQDKDINDQILNQKDENQIKFENELKKSQQSKQLKQQTLQFSQNEALKLTQIQPKAKKTKKNQQTSQELENIDQSNLTLKPKRQKAKNTKKVAFNQDIEAIASDQRLIEDNVLSKRLESKSLKTSKNIQKDNLAFTILNACIQTKQDIQNDMNVENKSLEQDEIQMTEFYRKKIQDIDGNLNQLLFQKKLYAKKIEDILSNKAEKTNQGNIQQVNNQQDQQIENQYQEVQQQYPEPKGEIEQQKVMQIYEHQKSNLIDQIGLKSSIEEIINQQQKLTDIQDQKELNKTLSASEQKQETQQMQSPFRQQNKSSEIKKQYKFRFTSSSNKVNVKPKLSLDNMKNINKSFEFTENRNQISFNQFNVQNSTQKFDKQDEMPDNFEKDDELQIIIDSGVLNYIYSQENQVLNEFSNLQKENKKDNEHVNDQELHLDSQIFYDGNENQQQFEIIQQNDQIKEIRYQDQRNAIETKYKEQLGLSIINETLNENHNQYNSLYQSKNSEDLRKIDQSNNLDFDWIPQQSNQLQLFKDSPFIEKSISSFQKQASHSSFHFNQNIDSQIKNQISSIMPSFMSKSSIKSQSSFKPLLIFENISNQNNFNLQNSGNFTSPFRNPFNQDFEQNKSFQQNQTNNSNKISSFNDDQSDFLQKYQDCIRLMDFQQNKPKYNILLKNYSTIPLIEGEIIGDIDSDFKKNNNWRRDFDEEESQSKAKKQRKTKQQENFQKNILQNNDDIVPLAVRCAMSQQVEKINSLKSTGLLSKLNNFPKNQFDFFQSENESIFQPQIQNSNFQFSMSQSIIPLNQKKDGLEMHRQFLENNGLKVNKSMGKALIKRLYNELIEYQKSGKIPNYLIEDNQRKTEVMSAEEIFKEQILINQQMANADLTIDDLLSNDQSEAPFAQLKNKIIESKKAFQKNNVIEQNLLKSDNLMSDQDFFSIIGQFK